MKKTRRRYDRDFKISVLAELDAGKPLAQVAREYGIHPSLPCRWKTELAENPQKKKHSEVTEISTKIRQGLQNWNGFLAKPMLKLNF